MKFTLRKKIILSAILPLLLLGASIIIIAATIVKGSIISKVEESLKGTAVATQAAYDQNAGSYLKAENGAIWKGSYNISQSETLVDTIKEESGMDVTFFYGSDRIMTSAKDKDGNRLTDFISIKVRGPLAERCAEFAWKGCKLAASGDFETITFADEPERQPGFLIKATEVEFLSPRRVEESAVSMPADGMDEAAA
mgnify:CR=1 FL=1